MRPLIQGVKFLMSFSDTAFWIALMQIIGVNIVLSGDNAVVIALAARSLPPKQQNAAVMWGSGAAVVMRGLVRRGGSRAAPAPARVYVPQRRSSPAAT